MFANGFVRQRIVYHHLATKVEVLDGEWDDVDGFGRMETKGLRKGVHNHGRHNLGVNHVSQKMHVITVRIVRNVLYEAFLKFLVHLTEGSSDWGRPFDAPQTAHHWRMVQVMITDGVALERASQEMVDTVPIPGMDSTVGIAYQHHIDRGVVVHNHETLDHVGCIGVLWITHTHVVKRHVLSYVRCRDIVVDGDVRFERWIVFTNQRQVLQKSLAILGLIAVNGETEYHHLAVSRHGDYLLYMKKGGSLVSFGMFPCLLKLGFKNVEGVRQHHIRYGTKANLCGKQRSID